MFLIIFLIRIDFDNVLHVDYYVIVVADINNVIVVVHGDFDGHFHGYIRMILMINLMVKSKNQNIYWKIKEKISMSQSVMDKFIPSPIARTCNQRQRILSTAGKSKETGRISSVFPIQLI
jgi:hypothetical protein